MLEASIPDETIAKLTGLSQGILNKLKAELKNWKTSSESV